MISEADAAQLCRQAGQGQKVPPANSRLLSLNAQEGAQGRKAGQSVRGPSALEVRFADALRDFGPDLPVCEPEYSWLPGRRFRADFAFVPARLLIEIEGGCHVVRSRFAGDCRKNNLMLLNGWRLLRFCAAQMDASEEDCIAQVRAALKGV